jgi:hypothetical protein
VLSRCVVTLVRLKYNIDLPVPGNFYPDVRALGQVARPQKMLKKRPSPTTEHLNSYRFVSENQ